MTPEDELREFLRKPKTDADDAEPPPLPPHLENLPYAIYLTAALEYLDDYRFVRPATFNPKTHQDWDQKARSYFKACVEVDRTSLASINPLCDANLVQQRFIHEVLFKQRWALEGLASEMMALVALVRWETRMASVVATPMTPGTGRVDIVKDKVRLRDENCRLSGLMREKKDWTNEEAKRIEEAGLITANMRVAHGMPFGMGETSFQLVEVLTGLPISTWGDAVDCVENALLMQTTLQKLFGQFRIYLESDPNHDIYIRARSTPAKANPRCMLRAILNNEARPCTDLIDTRLQPRNRLDIPDIDMKFFILHRFIGDIVWRCGGVELESDDEDEDGGGLHVLSAENWLIFKQKLTS